MPFSFLIRRNLAEHARGMSLGSYTPAILLEGLQTGVDNVRQDVYLSPGFCDTARQHISRLIAKYGNVEDFMAEDPFANATQSRPAATLPRPMPQAGRPQPPKPYDPAEYKRQFAELHTTSLNTAKHQTNVSVDLLARLAVLKFLRGEMTAQFSQILERCRARLKAYDGPRATQPKAVDMRERFAHFQVNKKAILRRCGQDLFSAQREVEKETLGRMRRSLFGDLNAATYDLFTNRLLYTEDARDDFLNAEQYVMLGNYERDPDRFQTMLDIACEFLRALELSGVDESGVGSLLNVPENAHELVGSGPPDDSSKGKAQRALLNAWVDVLERGSVMEHVIASYEVVSLLAQYSPPINPQQLKNALISKTERKRVETLLEEHGKISPDNLHSAVRKVESAKNGDRARLAGRFLSDFMRYHRDYRRMEAIFSAMDGVNVIANERLRELSAINNTLYEVLLPTEQKPAEEKVVHHVILKADIRDSSTLTRSLHERGLNPASYFSLNFYEPINKLLPKYDATKVFIEGDAVILALFEREGEPGFGVSRMCVLAKEMLEIVKGYNERSQQQGLPMLELGIGISYQDSAPLYLMDGNNRIMISRSLNESDRLSSCSKGARKFLNGQVTAATLFNVFSFQTVDDEDTGGLPDEFLVRYNIGGVHISVEAFAKLASEISLQAYDLKIKNPWVRETTRLYAGMVPVGPGIFHKIVVREGFIPHVHATDMQIQSWTERKYYEVCTVKTVYEYFDKLQTQAAIAQ